MKNSIFISLGLVILFFSCSIEKEVIPTESIFIKSNKEITIGLSAKQKMHPIRVYDSCGVEVRSYPKIEMDSLISQQINIPKNGSFKVSGLLDISMNISNNDDILSIDASNCSAISFLNSNNSKNIKSINVSNNKAIKYLYSENCVNLISLDVSNCTNLNSLMCNNTLLDSLEIDSCINLRNLFCSSCPKLTKLILDNANLEHISCHNCNSLWVLSLTNCNSLETIYCYNSKSLRRIFLPDNLYRIKKFSCSDCPVLSGIWFDNTAIINDIPSVIIKEILSNASNTMGCSLFIHKNYERKKYHYSHSDNEFLGPY